MNHIREPNYKFEYKCGAIPFLSFDQKPVLCETCKRLPSERRPKDCKNIVVEDYGIKY